MTQPDDEDDEAVIFDRVDDAVRSHTDAPELIGRGETLRGHRSRVVAQCVDRRRQSAFDGGVKPGECPVCRWFELYVPLTHGASESELTLDVAPGDVVLVRLEQRFMGFADVYVVLVSLDERIE